MTRGRCFRLQRLRGIPIRLGIDFDSAPDMRNYGNRQQEYYKYALISSPVDDHERQRPILPFLPFAILAHLLLDASLSLSMVRSRLAWLMMRVWHLASHTSRGVDADVYILSSNL
jgi:hypothetical protein